MNIEEFNYTENCFCFKLDNKWIIIDEDYDELIYKFDWVLTTEGLVGTINIENDFKNRKVLFSELILAAKRTSERVLFKNGNSWDLRLVNLRLVKLKKGEVKPSLKQLLTKPKFSIHNQIKPTNNSVKVERVKKTQIYIPNISAFDEGYSRTRLWRNPKHRLPTFNNKAYHVFHKHNVDQVNGVTRIKHKVKGKYYYFWNCSMGSKGCRKTRMFSCKKYGNTEAKRMAVLCRFRELFKKGLKFNNPNIDWPDDLFEDSCDALDFLEKVRQIEDVRV